MGRRIFSSILALAISLMLVGGVIAAPPTQYCKDLDHDGYGDPADCEAAYEAGLVPNGDDCNDTPIIGELINPDAEDVCGDLIDNNCDGNIDGGCPGAPTGNISYCIDLDGDGYGDSTDCLNDPEPGYIANDGDCDDADGTINPVAIELCGDGIDNNCINGIDEGCSTTDSRKYYYLDADNDLYGNPDVWEYTVNPSAGYVANSNDCNDQDLAINPAAVEICSMTDLTDENCNNLANENCFAWWEDADSDGFTSGINYYDSFQQADYVLDTSLVSMDLDCNDQDATVNPGAPEIYGDQIDQNCDGEISLFADQNLETCVLQHTGGSLDPTDLAALTSLNCYNRNVSILTGIENLTGLKYLFMSYNSISDLTPLANLTSLTRVELQSNLISDLSPLANLTNVNTLNLQDNNISDLTHLANLTRLVHLFLSYNSISDLTGLENLTGVPGWPGLTNLYFHYNNVSDLTPLTNLPIKSLSCANNSISDLTPLANITSLGMANLSNNNISDLSPLSNLPLIYKLELDFNSITDLTPLANLTTMTRLYMSHNSISDLTPLANLTGLKLLNLSHNLINDLSPLTNANLPLMGRLELEYNFISELTPLATITNLYALFLTSNYISDLTPLAALTNLGTLNLIFNCITDFSPVAHVPNVYGIAPYYQQQCM